MKKLFASILILFIVAALCVSCTGASDISADISAENSDDTQSETSTQEQNGDFYGNPDIYIGDEYSGRTFTVLTSDADTAALSEIVYNETDVNGESMPEKINDALRERADKLMRNYGVELKEIYLCELDRYGGEAVNYIRTAIDSGLDEFQVIDVSLYDCGILSLENALYNLYDVDNFNPANPWWDQGFNDSVEMAGKLFFTTGDVDLRNKSATTCIIFNATLIDTLGLENPYDLITQNQWTIDKVLELAKSYSEDKDADDRITYNDGFGWAGQYDDMYSLLYGSGVRIVSADSDGYPALSFYNKKTDNVVTKVLEFMQENKYYISGNDLFNEFTWPMNKLLECFSDGQCLFFSGIIEPVFQLRNMTDEFGIAPSPKYDSTQENYYSLLNTWAANSMAIAANVSESDLPFVGAVLDALGYFSWKEYPESVAFNYYDVVLKSQRLTTEKAEVLLDLIFERRGCELGAIYQIGKNSGSGATVYDMLMNMMAADMTSGLASQYDAISGALQTSIDSMIDYFENAD